MVKERKSFVLCERKTRTSISYKYDYVITSMQDNCVRLIKSWINLKYLQKKMSYFVLLSKKIRFFQMSICDTKGSFMYTQVVAIISDIAIAVCE